MRVKMRTHYAGPRGAFPPGSVLDVDEAEAESLILGNYATEAGAAEVVETTAAPAQETADAAPNRRRRKS